MVAQVNLLPGLKQDKLNQKRTRRLIISIGTTVIVVAVSVPLLLFIYRSTQSLVISRTQSSINEKQEQIRGFENIITMLTTKQDLAELPNLYAQRLYMTELLKTFPDSTPREVDFTNLDVNSGGSFTVSGSTNSYRAVERLFEALSRANLDFNPERVADPSQTGRFSNLVLDSVGGPSGDEVSFNISGQFNTAIISSINGGDDGQQ